MVTFHRHTIHAPFCHFYGNKVRRIHRLWNVCVILAIVFAFVGACFDISKATIWGIFILVISGPVIAYLIWNPDKYIRMTDIQKDSIQFSIANPIYAQELRRLNATKSA